MLFQESAFILKNKPVAGSKINGMKGIDTSKHF